MPDLAQRSPPGVIGRAEPMFSPLVRASLAFFVAATQIFGTLPACAAPLTEAEHVQGIEWRFRAGSTLHAPPALASDGTSYVGTGDGSVEAISPLGVLEWSYMVEGSIWWAPVLDAAGRLYVATGAQRLYAFGPTGVMAWQIRTPALVATDPVVSRRWGLLFGGADTSVWAYSLRANALFHVPLGSPIVDGPVTRDGRIVVATMSGATWLLDGAVRVAIVRLGARVQSIVGVLQDDSVSVIAGNALVHIDSRGHVAWRRDDVEWAASERGRSVAIDSRGWLVRLRDDGTETAGTSLGARASDAPSIAPGGTVFVPTDSGELAIVDPQGNVRRVSIAHAPLKRPVVDVTGHRVLVAAGNGTLVALRFSE